MLQLQQLLGEINLNEDLYKWCYIWDSNKFSVKKAYRHLSGHLDSRWQRGPVTRYPMGIYSIRVLIWSKTHTHGYVNGAKPSPIGYVGYGDGVAGPIPVYPWVKNTRPKIKEAQN
jgi:hypothetical protein